MPEVDFLTENPVVRGMRQAQQADTERSRGQLIDMQVEGQRAQAREEQAATAALNRIYATGGPKTSMDVHSQLAADPSLGGSRRLNALQQSEEDDRKRTQVEAQARERDARQFKMYLENGLDGAASEQARKMGLNIPPTFWTNQAQRREMLEKLEVEEKRARINQSNASAGASRALAGSRTPDTHEDFTDAEGRVVRRDRRTGESKYIAGPDGQPIRVETKRSVAEVGAQSREAVAAGRDATNLQREEARAGARGSAGGRPLNIEARRQMLVDAGLDPREAALISAGGTITPAQRIAIRQRIQAGVVGAKDFAGRPQFKTPLDQRAEAARREADIFGAVEGGASNAPRGGPTSKSPAQPLPRDASGRPDTTKLDPGVVYLFPHKQGQSFVRWNPDTSTFDEVE